MKAKDEGSINDVPVDAFRVEYYRQGELAEVADNPLKNPLLLQEFLDRHLTLSDLLSKETQLVAALAQNSAQLIPLEGSSGQLKEKKLLLEAVNKKLAIAEEGKLKEIAADQGKLSNEKSLGTSLAHVRDTIMLTIAMLAESNIPLVIDQPEDDLDNAFIFSAVVRVLRTIKERRQVVLVTHNANIAVLGDAELLFPMRRTGDCGQSFDRGSIDKAETKTAVLKILEGGFDRSLSSSTPAPIASAFWTGAPRAAGRSCRASVRVMSSGTTKLGDLAPAGLSPAAFLRPPAHPASPYLGLPLSLGAVHSRFSPAMYGTQPTFAKRCSIPLTRSGRS